MRMRPLSSPRLTARVPSAAPLSNGTPDNPSRNGGCSDGWPGSLDRDDHPERRSGSSLARP